MKRQGPPGNCAVFILCCWKNACISGVGCRVSVLWTATGVVDGLIIESDKDCFIIKQHQTIYIFFNIKRGWLLYERTRRRDPSPGLKEVYLFIVVKQWSIVLSQHKRSICSCGRKVENSSHFFPPSLSNNLQTPFVRFLVTTWLIHPPKTLRKTVVTCYNVIHLSIHDKVAGLTICMWCKITPRKRISHLIPKRTGKTLAVRLGLYFIAT